jgi:hypothetical protein
LIKFRQRWFKQEVVHYILRSINIKFRQKWFKQEVVHYILRSININSIWNEDELPQQGTKSITVLVYKKGDKSGCSSCRGISRLPTVYIILSNIPVSGLTPCVNEIIGENRCGFRRNVSNTDQIFGIGQTLKVGV